MKCQKQAWRKWSPARWDQWVDKLPPEGHNRKTQAEWIDWVAFMRRRFPEAPARPLNIDWFFDDDPDDNDSNEVAATGVWEGSDTEHNTRDTDETWNESVHTPASDEEEKLVEPGSLFALIQPHSPDDYDDVFDELVTGLDNPASSSIHNEEPDVPQEKQRRRKHRSKMDITLAKITKDAFPTMVQHKKRRRCTRPRGDPEPTEESRVAAPEMPAAHDRMPNISIKRASKAAKSACAATRTASQSSLPKKLTKDGLQLVGTQPPKGSTVRPK